MTPGRWTASLDSILTRTARQSFINISLQTVGMFYLTAGWCYFRCQNYYKHSDKSSANMYERERERERGGRRGGGCVRETVLTTCLCWATCHHCTVYSGLYRGLYRGLYTTPATQTVSLSPTTLTHRRVVTLR